MIPFLDRPRVGTFIETKGRLVVVRDSERSRMGLLNAGSGGWRKRGGKLDSS